MDIFKTAAEIGMMEVLRLIQPHMQDPMIARINPVPSNTENMKQRINDVAQKMMAYGKQRLLFLSPETALLDRLSQLDSRQEVILVLPCDMDELTAERLCKNMPHALNVTILTEPFFPEGFTPSNGMLFLFGFHNNGRMLLSPESYRLMERYSAFQGRKAFVPFIHQNINRLENYFDVYMKQEEMYYEDL